MLCPSESVRIYKSCAVVLGFMVHLVMDEIWSIDVRRGFRLKKSFGTALKFFSNSALANISVYAKLILLLYLALGDHDITERVRARTRLDDPYIAQPLNDRDDWNDWMPWR